MDLYKAIKEELLLELPGIAAQEKLVPKHTRIPLPQSAKQNAAVGLILLSDNKNTDIIFTKRATYDGHHSGQVSFPGGKEEKLDNSLLETAIRETSEEIGIGLLRQEYLGKLTPLYIPVSNFIVHPFVFFHKYKSNINFTIDKKEVEYVILFALKALLDKELVKTTSLKINSSYTLTTPYYAIKKEIVWGATAMILSEFVEILERISKKRQNLFT
jgi:8-oxo-dGTP pyrophosphatase MutT (NUDIX family)